MTTTQTTGDRLFQAILERPGDDDLRLVFADWLEENGESEYGEFIRVQVRLAQHHTAETGCPLRRREEELLGGVCGLVIEALPIIEGLTRTSFVGRGGYGWFQRGKPANGIEARFRRGFVSEVTLTLEAWVGRECPECRGWRRVSVPTEEVVFVPQTRRCLDCHGKGRVDAHGPALVQAAPLEVVRVSDREPRQLGSTEQHFWYLGSIYPEQQAHDIPEVIWPFLVGEENRHSPVSVHDTHDLAHAALSRALLAWAHGQPTG